MTAQLYSIIAIPDLYSTTASIVGVWLSAVGSLSLALFTHIFTQNMQYFTLLRDEKRNFFYSVIDRNITFAGTFSDNQKACDKCIIALDEISEICKQSQDKIKENLHEDIDKISNLITRIIYCYPDPAKLVKFLTTETFLTIDDGYKPWLDDYRQRIDYNKKEKTFDELDTYLKTIDQNGLDTEYQSEIMKIKDVMEKLKIIDSSINKIDILKRDYQNTDAILSIIKSNTTIAPILGTLFFGVVIPLYMLLPTQLHINIIPECVVIIGIFAGLSVCGYGTYNVMKQIVNLLIKK